MKRPKNAHSMSVTSAQHVCASPVLDAPSAGVTSMRGNDRMTKRKQSTGAGSDDCSNRARSQSTAPIVSGTAAGKGVAKSSNNRRGS